MCICMFFSGCKKDDKEKTDTLQTKEDNGATEESVDKDIISAEESLSEHFSFDESSTIETVSSDVVSAFAGSKYYGLKELNYVALGDSIARGYGLDEPELSCYPALLANSMSVVLDNTTVNYVNYAVDGMTTQGLIDFLAESSEKLVEADLITVCIGANNLLQPFLNVIKKHMPSLVSSSGVISGEDAQSSVFIDAVKAIEAELEGKAFSEEMSAGVEKLKDDLVFVIDELNRCAPKADVVITTVYSPYHGIDLSLPYLEISLDLGGLSDQWVSLINNEIVRIAQEKSCTLVEAYHPFESAGGLVNASLKIVPLNFNFDPHPNQKGHIKLSNLHLEAIKEIE